MPPSFYPVSQADQLAFFLHVSGSCELPVMLYNFPELTCNRIGLETISAFADRAPMAGIKQSGGEFSYHRELIALGREKGFNVFSGADTRLNEVFALGATGCIGGLVNFVPEYMVSIFRACRKGSSEDITLAVARMKEVGAFIDKLSFPWNVSAGVVARGFEAGAPRSVVSAHSAALHATIVADLHQRFEAWGLPLPRIAA
jgi:4-hydroxy-tetrahydrodipicolinate synthase